jgi:hypothetical protein
VEVSGDGALTDAEDLGATVRGQSEQDSIRHHLPLPLGEPAERVEHRGVDRELHRGRRPGLGDPRQQPETALVATVSVALQVHRGPHDPRRRARVRVQLGPACPGPCVGLGHELLRVTATACGDHDGTQTPVTCRSVELLELGFRWERHACLPKARLVNDIHDVSTNDDPATLTHEPRRSDDVDALRVRSERAVMEVMPVGVPLRLTLTPRGGVQDEAMSTIGDDITLTQRPVPTHPITGEG